MSTLEKEAQLRRLRALTAQVRGQDKQLAQESADLGRNETLEVQVPIGRALDDETIVLRRTRPVLAIKQNTTEPKFADHADSEIWRDRLTKAKPFLDAVIRAVGRIELTGHSDFAWVGTGWLVGSQTLVTNRHVASAFAERNGRGFVFRVGPSGPIRASVDFVQEIDSAATALFRLASILHIEDATGPDLSFFAVELLNGSTLAAPIPLASTPVESPTVATIGYPAFDSRIPESDLMARIFGGVYDKKRLAPGAVTRVEPTRILHNCTTLGGNSGSVVIELTTGEAVGLHFSGTFLSTNYAVRSDIIAQRLAQVQGERTARPSALVPVTPLDAPREVRRPPPTPANDRPRLPEPLVRHSGASITVPLTITVSLGEALAARTPSRRPAQTAGTARDREAIEIAEEGTPADYANRTGYREDFLGHGRVVALPAVRRDEDDVLSFDDRGKRASVLRYEHFSVAMSESRRMCLFSAANIDGAQLKKDKRAPWRYDPRIPRSQQIMKECYGDNPKFSRGHMTRREDPGWGDAPSAKRGNEDSMHVTNTTPQMQAFNSPIWLALENYALEHARVDGMKISVFTGPYFAPDDPVMYGVQIPLAFWKIIAFIHDKTHELVATGYEMSQEDNVEQSEFVFGGFVSPQLNIATQVSISSIELHSGIDFGVLASRDPFADEEGVGGGKPLVSFDQIRFE
jgi:endonuclease G